jgi:hypothetical protein
MRNILSVFGRSPFSLMIEHARKVNVCVGLIKPIADAILADDMQRLDELQHQVSKTEYEADLLKDDIRQNLPHHYFLPVDREDVSHFLRQMDTIADGAQDFAVVATFRKLRLAKELHAEFSDLVDKVVEVSDSLVHVVEQLATLQREAFDGPDTDEVLRKIKAICHMEWESDKLSRKLARHYYAMDNMDPVTIILLDKLTEALRGIADHSENVGKNLRLMIARK